ncbi:MAD2L1-binding protein [Odontesthes bonariensis]|uniref:MAD2L1-binding protein n=1 Tax=Odontesthes bonariensis TaxID=219752 RepID=UPI003F582BEA
MTCSVLSLQSVSDDSPKIAEQRSPEPVGTCLKEECAFRGKGASPEQHRMSDREDQENAAEPSTAITEDNTEEDISGHDSNVTASQQHPDTEERDAEVVKRAHEEGCVNVVFPGTVTQDGCYRFVSEILKCILYQRQQLPMTYDQLVYSQKKQQASLQDKDTVSRRPVQSKGMDWRKCQQTLQELEEVLHQLEVLFSLSSVPRVLLLMGGSLILPTELYEINMEDLVLAGGDQCLRVSSCLRQLFRTLFVADLLSDTRPVRLMSTTVMALAHRDCSVAWFRPKLQFKVPTRVKHQVIALSSDPTICKKPKAEGSDWQDYVWFQSPTAIKGFSN